MTDLNNYDNIQNFQIPKSDFILMINSVDAFVNTNKRTPNIVYLRKDGIKQIQYITYNKYSEMIVIWNAFIKTTGRDPEFIRINEPSITYDTVVGSKSASLILWGKSFIISVG